MDSYIHLPDAEINDSGVISRIFLKNGIKSFKDACMYVHEMDYGYNSNYDDELILFKEKKGTCTSKHGTIAGLAEELGIPLYKNVGIYKFTEEISSSTDEILKKYDIPYIPMVHCFLVYKNYKFDLTEGNNNGKKTSIEKFIHQEQVKPFISRKDEYLILKRVLKEIILPSNEMKGVKEKSLLKARLEAVNLLKENMKS